VLRIIVNTIPPILSDQMLHSVGHVRHADAFALHYVFYVTRIHLVAAAPANRRRGESIAVYL